jgi:hypothetical protein
MGHSGAPGDRCGARAGNAIKDCLGADDEPRGARRWSSVGKYNFEDLSLPRRPLVREDESRHVYV